MPTNEVTTTKDTCRCFNELPKHSTTESQRYNVFRLIPFPFYYRLQVKLASNVRFCVASVSSQLGTQTTEKHPGRWVGWWSGLFLTKTSISVMRDPAFRIGVWPTPYTSISVNAWPLLWLRTETMVYVPWSNLLFVQFPQKRLYSLNILCWYS